MDALGNLVILCVSLTMFCFIRDILKHKTKNHLTEDLNNLMFEYMSARQQVEKTSDTRKKLMAIDGLEKLESRILDIAKSLKLPIYDITKLYKISPPSTTTQLQTRPNLQSVN